MGILHGLTVAGLTVLCLTVLSGCGSAATAEKILDQTDNARMSIARDRNQLLIDLLHDKAIYAVRDAASRAKLALLAVAKDGTVSVETATGQLDTLALAVNQAAATRAVNRDQVEMLNVAEERANALDLGLRIQIEAAKGIFGRVMESLATWQATRAAAKAVTQPDAATSQPAIRALEDL
jgi:hypothetical protein